ncbi:hypothetical protein BDZ89DRAFT_988280 [Hymenopellis radicata]|nr:hypothetical protein BDZ89DRAFT_988280 [Hymenopellis radicata]
MKDDLAMPIISIHERALDVCYTIYGEAELSSDILDRFYEPSARYQNPALSASSRTVIHNIFKFGRKIHGLDVPRPLAVFYTILHLPPPDFVKDPIFQVLRAWNDVGTVSEHESFDGQKQAIVEHTLNLLFLPEIHIDGNPTAALSFPAVRRRSRHHHIIGAHHNELMASPNYHPGCPSIAVPGTSFMFPSPFHFKLHIITRLSFNEQGRITEHRDYWDVKDLMGLCPVLPFAQWIGSRVAALGLSYAYRLLPKNPDERGNGHLDRMFSNDPGLQGLVIDPKRDPRHH